MPDATEPLAPLPEVNANDATIALWNTTLFDKFARFRDLIVANSGAHGRVALARHPPRHAASVLEIGAGFGDHGLELAHAVGPDGHVVCVDAAPRFVDAARALFAAAGLTRVEARLADAQSTPLGGPYDHVYSRFGTMFFADPVLALANIRRSLAPGGRLCMVVWRRRDATPIYVLAPAIVRGVLGLAPPPEPSSPGPGPFSMASPDLVSDQLLAAGFVRPTFERSDLPMTVGRDLDEAVDFALTLGPGGEAMRLAGPAADQRRPEIRAALAAALAPLGLTSPSSVWIVTALNPT